MNPLFASPHRFGALTYLDIRDRATQGWLAVVPTGCTEQQGPHLPVDFDTWFSEELMLAAAERAAREHNAQALVLAAMPFGPTPEHRNYGSGYIHIPAELHQALVRSVLDSLAEQGFTRLVLWRGCGGHVLDSVVEAFNQAHAGRARAFLPGHPYHDIWCRIGDPNVPGGHADSFTTSIALHLRPELVNEDRIYNPHHPPLDWEEPNLDFARYSTSGVIGDPTQASAELGEKLWHATVEAAAQVLKQVADSEIEEPT
ncbi:MAG TPA: creatininase family protein [Ardenticatenaceae bacterium]|jgi:creatinine amidohydrolase